MARAEKPPTVPAPDGASADADVRLMLGVKADRAGAFEELYDAYASRAFAFAFRYTRDRTAAEDLAQEAFLRVYRARRSYEPRARFSTWFFRILINLCHSRRRVPEVPLEHDGTGSPAGPIHADPAAPDPAREVQRAEVRRLVRDAVAALPPNQRVAVLLSRFEGHSQAEVGLSMDLSAKAVKSLLARARENLRRKLGPHL